MNPYEEILMMQHVDHIAKTLPDDGGIQYLVEALTQTRKELKEWRDGSLVFRCVACKTTLGPVYNLRLAATELLTTMESRFKGTSSAMDACFDSIRKFLGRRFEETKKA